MEVLNRVWGYAGFRGQQSEIIDHVIERAMEKVESGTRVAEEGVVERAVEAIGQSQDEGRARSETVS